jgi:hypothetical protein
MKKAIIILTAFILAGCSGSGSKQQRAADSREVTLTEAWEDEDMDNYSKGTYGYDVNFLRKIPGTIELKNDFSRLLISLKYQGRVMTSSSEGYEGKSYGWINYDLIESGEVLPQFNPVGGEERFWLGPEGGQFSLFFEAGSSFAFEDWATPASIDTEPFESYLATDSAAVFLKPMKVKNYSNFEFSFDLMRKIDLMGKPLIAEKLGIDLPAGVRMVGYETTNIIKNTGSQPWKKETGLISIWLLGMFNPSPSVTMMLPYKTGVRSDYIVKDDYFGKIPSDRLKVTDGMIFFKGDGQQRGKLGIPPERAMPVMGSYDSENRILTIVKTTLHEGVVDYVNSAWEQQEFPYKGDAINAYNDGPLENGGQLGPFYELESSSPALALAPGSSAEHIQSTYHFEGTEEELDTICRLVFNISVEEIKKAF